MPVISRSPLANQDYIDIWQYIAADNRDAANRVLRRIDEKLDIYARNPGMGTNREDFMPDLCSFPVGMYIVFYQAIPGGIELVRVLHGSQDLSRFFKS